MEHDQDREQRIDEDMPCVRCAYNLRGLPDEGNCPECGAPIEETLDYVFARVLCPACMAPNHPSVAICEQCKSPISGAAATANYYRTPMVSAPRKPNAVESDEPDSPSQGPLVLAWLFGAFMLFIATICASAWSSNGSQLIALFFLITLPPSALIIFFVSTRRYQRAWRAYTVAFAAYEAKEYGPDAPPPTSLEEA